MFVCIVMYICLVFYIFSGLLGSGWFGCLFVLMYCKECGMFKMFSCIFPLPSLLGSGWLGYLPLSGSPGLYTPTVLCISCVCTVVHAPFVDCPIGGCTWLYVPRA